LKIIVRPALTKFNPASQWPRTIKFVAAEENTGGKFNCGARFPKDLNRHNIGAL
jgi:hypothetical protein